MRIKFDARQKFQTDAVEAISGLFEGQPAASAFASVSFAASAGELFDELGVGNRLVVPNERVLENLRRIQEGNGIAPLSAELSTNDFSVEMETGTGKTYVYLRTAYELNARFGFKKFVIVVPSVAIREGVQVALQMTREHFAGLYNRVPCETWTYDSRKLSRLRQFALSNQMQILIINIAAFNRDENVFRNEQDTLSGRRPIEFVQACRPVVIVDEPQSMDSTLARAAITSLRPTCTLRYSATHRDPYNLVYRLDPVRAYDLRLVKRIEVASVVDEADFNRPYIKIERIEARGRRVIATMTMDVKSTTRTVRRRVSVSVNGTDLFDLSGGREAYRGYVVDHIDAANGYIEFGNGVVLSTGAEQGGHRDDVMRAQVRETVREHLEKELMIRHRLPAGRRVKVLSLFFIDAVDNYAKPDGKIRRWFLDAYREFSSMARFAVLGMPPVETAHGGYFAEVDGQPRDTSGSTAADDELYAKIMRGKERLLALDEPLRFIFSHSALREGWDNPNVFQICTLAEARSEIRKRQEIGRGLRLPVDETGERCLDESVNRLTVIANESYEQFARELQTQIEEDCGVEFSGRIANRRERKRASLKKGWRANADFLALWERLKHRTRYSVEFSTEALVAKARERLAAMPRISAARIVTRKAALRLDKDGVSGDLLSMREAELEHDLGLVVPDAIAYVQQETELTRASIARILIESGRLADMLSDPQQFLDRAVKEIRGAMQDLMVGGIKYEKVAGAEYEMYLFEQQEVESYIARMVGVRHSIYDQIECDSDVERRFAEELDAREDVKLFIKLPRWFKVETPLGTYNPDWAIVMETDAKVYLVRETKGSADELRLRKIEWGKIQCAGAHFEELGVSFKTVTSAREI